MPLRHIQMSPLSMSEVVDTSSGAVLRTREDLILDISYPTGDRLTLLEDGTRVGHAAGGGWAIEFELGALPSVHGSHQGVIQVRRGIFLALLDAC